MLQLNCIDNSVHGHCHALSCSTEIKATDFGLSIFFKPRERFNELVGSPYYVAPEVLKKNYSFEADIWSLGVILYILLSGLPPFWGDNEEQIFKMVLKGHVDFATEPWPKISSAAKDLVKRLLTMDATKRCGPCVPPPRGPLQSGYVRQCGSGYLSLEANVIAIQPRMAMAVSTYGECQASLLLSGKWLAAVAVGSANATVLG